MLIKDFAHLPYEYCRCVSDLSNCPHGGVCRRREPGCPSRQLIGHLHQLDSSGACENRIITTKQWEAENGTVG